MPRSYIEVIDRPTVLFVLYSMVTAQHRRTFVSNREQFLKSAHTGEKTPFAFSKPPCYVIGWEGWRH